MEENDFSLNTKSKRKFDGAKDFSKYFNENILKLVDYISTGVKKHYFVYGAHIVQLAEKVGVQILSNGHIIKTLPNSFVRPSKFDNIEEIITKGYVMFQPKFLH